MTNSANPPTNAPSDAECDEVIKECLGLMDVSATTTNDLRVLVRGIAAVLGDDACEMSVRVLPAGAVKPDEDNPDESPAGLYAHATDYPEEGCIYLGPVDADAAIAKEKP